MKTLSYAPQIVTAEELNTSVEFNSPFIVNEDGTVMMSDNSAPDEVIGGYETDEGAYVHELYVDGNWVPWSHGYTGQDRYSGPILHNSEQLSGRMAEDLLSEPGEYCICEVSWENNYEPEDINYDDPLEVEGWVVLKAV